MKLMRAAGAAVHEHACTAVSSAARITGRRRMFSTTTTTSFEGNPDVIVCGAGVAGVATARHLARDHGMSVVLVDERSPMSYTSSYSTECYRNFWGANADMTGLVNRSIDLLEERAAESDNAFSMNRRGYFFLTAREDGVAEMVADSQCAEDAGVGSARVFSDGGHGHVYDPDMPYNAEVDGVDVFVGQDAIQSYLPGFVSTEVTAMMHVKRCGWMNAQQMGTYLLQDGRETGLVKTMSPYAVTGLRSVGTGGGVEVDIVGVRNKEASTLSAGAFVNCAGPFIANIHDMVPGGLELPIEHEVHSKVIMNDVLEKVPCDRAPMMIWNDPVELKWTDDEREMLAEMGGYEAKLLDPLPAGVHFRPYPGAVNSLVMLWEFAHLHIENGRVPVEQPEFLDYLYPELVLRGLSEMVPGLEEYLEKIPPSTQVDGGYYTKVPDNMPVIGPATASSTSGFYSCAGISGYGVMASNAAGELAAMHVAGVELPEYAPAFLPARWEDAAYVADVAAGNVVGLQI